MDDLHKRLKQLREERDGLGLFTLEGSIAYEDLSAAIERIEDRLGIDPELEE